MQSRLKVNYKEALESAEAKPYSEVIPIGLGDKGLQMQSEMYFVRDLMRMFPDLKDSTLRSWIKRRCLRPKKFSGWNHIFTAEDVETIRQLMNKAD